MKRLLNLCVTGALLASVSTVSAAERSYFKKSKPRVSRAYKSNTKAPRLFSQALIMTQATSPVPPAPAAEGDGGAPPPHIEPMPAGIPGAVDAIQLYDCVKYEDLDNVHPCAVPKIVSIVDPCQKASACCGPRCVYVQICVPPTCDCECPTIKVTRGGRKVKYDYGKYEIEVTSKRGTVYVDYDNGLLNNF